MRRVSIIFVAAMAALFVVPGSAGAATQIGGTFNPSIACAADTTFLQAVSPRGGGGQYTARTNGVITLWAYRAPASGAGSVKLKVGRRAGLSQFAIVGESGLENPAANTVNTFATQITVRGGDVIGLYQNSATPCAATRTRYQVFSRNEDVPLGTTAAFSGPDLQRLDVSAILEPDCDADGLGDESQDNDVSTCATCEGKRATVVGTRGADVLGGTPGRDVFVGFAGNDKLSGFAGNDLFCGGKGKDKLNGGKGNDKLLGNKGNDKLTGGKGKDFCLGGGGKDTAFGCEKQRKIP